MFANTFRQIGSSIGGLIPDSGEVDSSFDAFGDEAKKKNQQTPAAPAQPNAPNGGGQESNGTATQRNVGMDPQNTDALARTFLPGQQGATFAQMQSTGQARPSPEVLGAQNAMQPMPIDGPGAAPTAQPEPVAPQPWQPQAWQPQTFAPQAGPDLSAVQSLFVPTGMPGDEPANPNNPTYGAPTYAEPTPAPATAAPTAPPLAPQGPTVETMPNPNAPTYTPPPQLAAPKAYAPTTTDYYMTDKGPQAANGTNLWDSPWFKAGNMPLEEWLASQVTPARPGASDGRLSQSALDAIKTYGLDPSQVFMHAHGGQGGMSLADFDQSTGYLLPQYQRDTKSPYTPEEEAMIAASLKSQGIPDQRTDPIGYAEWAKTAFPMPAGTPGAGILNANGGYDPALVTRQADGSLVPHGYTPETWAASQGQPAPAPAPPTPTGPTPTGPTTGTTTPGGATTGTTPPGGATTGGTNTPASSSPALADMFGLQQRIQDYLSNSNPYGVQQEQDAFNTLNGQLDERNGQDRRDLIEQMAARGLDSSTVHAVESSNLAAKQGRARNDLVSTIHQRAVEANDAARQNALRTAMAFQQSQSDNTYRDAHDQSAFLLQLAQLLGIDNYTGGATTNPFSGIDLNTLGK